MRDAAAVNGASERNGALRFDSESGAPITPEKVAGFQLDTITFA